MELIKGGFVGNQYLSEEISKNKFKNIKEGIILNNHNNYNLEDLISKHNMIELNLNGDFQKEEEII